MKKIYVSILTSLILAAYINAQPLEKKSEVSNDISRSSININNIFTTIYANGFTDYESSYQNFYFPTYKGEYMGSATGFVFGIKLPDESYPRVGGSYYRTGLQPGYINNDGTASDPTSEINKVYRVRPDIFPGGPEVDLSDEASSLGLTESSIRTNYENDWNNWPASIGAPFNDINNDGIYESTIDIPGVPGADQTLWYVANDLDSSLVKNLYGTQPIGIEVQVATWAYKTAGSLCNTIFRKFKFINKSVSSINPSGIVYDSMYVSLFGDADLSDYQDDIAGSDSALGLCYMYNSWEPPKNSGSIYPEPSLGFQLLRGPVVDSPGDTAYLNGREIFNKKNLSATSTMYTDRYKSVTQGDPISGDIIGSLQFYNLMRGRYSRSGEAYYDSVNQKYTHFIFDGDPVQGTGWFQKPNTPHDSRFGVAAGPFNMAPGDTQEVVFAEFAVLEKDRISSVRSLRFSASVIKKFFENKINFIDRPPVPVVQTSSDENGITLDWGSDQSSVNSIENFNSNGYKFQGYNVYQISAPIINFGDYTKKIEEFDLSDNIKDIYGLVPDASTGFPVSSIVQNGSDNGITRKITVPTDLFGQNYFIIGKTYYFAVSTYTYNESPDVINHSTESYIKIIPVVFREDYSGIKYSDVLVVNHITGAGDDTGVVLPIVTDPQLLNGDSYKVSIDTLDTGELVWNLYNTTTNTEVVKNQSMYDTVTVINGVNLLVKGSKNPPSWPSSFYVKLNSEYGDRILLGWAVESSSNLDVENRYQDLEFRFTGVPAADASNSNDTLIISGGSIATIYNTSKTIKKLVRIPFELWEVERNRQINVVVISDSSLLAGKAAPWGISGTPLWYRIGESYPNGDKIYSIATSYNPYLGTDLINLSNPDIIWETVLDGTWRTGDVVGFHFNNPLTTSDEYIFSTDPLNQLNKISKIPEDYILFQNYPNPFNPVTTIKYTIPANGYVKINVYNILGQLIKTLVNEQQEKGMHQLVDNFMGLSSGVYVYSLTVDGNFKSAKKMILLK